MRVVADPSALWCPTEGGAYLQTARGAWTVTGTSVATWLDHLVPLLDGQHTVERLTEGLDESRALVLTDLLDTLLECGAATVAHGAATEPIVHWLGTSGEPSQLLRPTRVLGAGPVAEALVGALERARVPQPPRTAAPAEAELVVAAGPEHAAHARLVGTTSALWIMLPGADGQPIGWESVAHRAKALGEEQVPTDDPPGVPTLIAAARLVRELVLAERGATPRGEPRLIRVDHASLAATAHRCPPVGRRTGRRAARRYPPVRGRARRRAAPWAVPAFTAAEFSERVTALCDDRVGVLSKMSEGALRQLPLHVSSVRVADSGSGEPATVLGHGPDLVAARVRGAATGLVRYASGLADAVLGEPRTGIDVADGQMTEVAGAAAGPHAAAAGLSWHDAVLGALLELTARLVGPTASGVPRQAGEDELLLQLYLDQLSLLDAPADVVDLGAVACAHTAMARGRSGVATVSGTSPAAARLGAVELLLARTQSAAAELPAAGPMLLGEPLDDAAARAAVERIARGLRERGFRVVATPLDDDLAVADLIPFLTRVVLINA